MRIRVRSIGDAERLSRLFEEAHIEHKGRYTWLVVDKVKGKKMARA